MKRYFLGVLLGVCVLGFSGVPGYGFSAGLHGVFAHIGLKLTDLCNAYLLMDNRTRFDRKAAEIENVLIQTATILQEPFIAKEGGLSLLRKNGLIKGGYIRTDDSVLIIGSIKAISEYRGNGYLVEEPGELHYIHTGSSYKIDVVINKRYITDSVQLKSYFVLYDAESGAVFTLAEEGKTAITDVRLADIDISEYLHRGPVFIKMNRVLMVRPLKPAGRKVYIVSVSPFIPGYSFFHAVALIVLLVSAILLLVHVLSNRMKSSARKVEGAHTMGKKSDIIREIDMEISDIIEEETAGKTKEIPKKQPEEVTDSTERLESDGIIIKK
jgi:hypothetical protein